MTSDPITTAQALLPCPFCGNKPMPVYYADKCLAYCIECSRCSASVFHGEESRITDEWNRRQLDAANAELETANKHIATTNAHLATINDNLRAQIGVLTKERDAANAELAALREQVADLNAEMGTSELEWKEANWRARKEIDALREQVRQARACDRTRNKVVWHSITATVPGPPPTPDQRPGDAQPPIADATEPQS